jgi:hypothetical protein
MALLKVGKIDPTLLANSAIRILRRNLQGSAGKDRRARGIFREGSRLFSRQNVLDVTQIPSRF